MAPAYEQGPRSIRMMTLHQDCSAVNATSAPGADALDDLAAAQELLRVWLDAAKAQLADPRKIGTKELNRLGELAMSAVHWLAERDRREKARASAGAFARQVRHLAAGGDAA